MSIKKYFEVAENIQSLANKSAADIGSVVESVGYHEQDIIEEERFIPRIDFSKPENFARYGSAEEYYAQSIKRIYRTYPYDGSLQERLKWRNASTYLDLYIVDEKYPRTTGYVIMSANGAATDSVADGYGRPTVPEYIYVKGGPNPHPVTPTPYSQQFTGSNYYQPSMNRGSNLELNMATQGATLEFWLKKDGFLAPDITSREVVFDLWNGELSSSDSYARLRLELSGNLTDGSDPFMLTAISGTSGIYRQPIASTLITSASVADGNWHHYAVTVKSASAGIATRFYVDGALDNESVLGSTGLGDLDSTTLRGYIGALITDAAGPGSADGTTAGDGKLSGSLDEFRYWKTQRSSKDIGRHWFTQVGGGVNADPTPFIETAESGNVDLGVYFKFNEGITGVADTDSVVLDYSGRTSNGAWTGYNTNSRNVGSAIISSSAAIKEFRDPIIYSFHPAVVALNDSLKVLGSAHDGINNAAVYNSIPAWITEDDIAGQRELLSLTQIMSSYFDTLQLQVESLNKLRDRQYPSGSDKPLPFAEKLLASQGLVAPDLFLDADILEKLADRGEDLVYEKSLHDIKNIIYQNIYNNLSYIYKTKGTEKSFRNLIRCFGIDEEIIKLNVYANNVEYQLRNNRKNVIVPERYIDFNTTMGSHAVVYNYADPSNLNSEGYIPSNTHLTGGYALTMETEILFPQKVDQASLAYVNTNTISSSLFGMYSASATPSDTTWSPTDLLNFQVYAVRDEINSTNARFLLSSSAPGLITTSTSNLYQNVYDNTKWNLSVRIKPSEYPLAGLVDDTTSNYIVELHGVQAEAGVVLEEFTVSQTIASPVAGFITGSRRAYIGAHRENFTGSVLSTSDIKVNGCRYWLDYLEDTTLRAHILDAENIGALQPHLYAYPFNPSASFTGDISKFDTLVFAWGFLTNTGSNSNGQFTVSDISSGSADLTRFGALGPILNKQYTASGSFFAPSSTKAIDADLVESSKLNLPEQLEASDMISVMSAQERDIFTTETRPTNFYFAFEKSMYQTISGEMVNYFANLKDLHNLIGDGVEKYRTQYKQLDHMRQKFFEKVQNDQLDFDKFYEFYKWFDSALSVLLAQLVPASAEFAGNIMTVIESHLLERPKYRRKFPFLERVGGNDVQDTADSSGESGDHASPDDFPSGQGILANSTFTRRQIGSSNPPYSKAWKRFHSPVSEAGSSPGTGNTNIYWHRYREEASDAVRTDLLAAIRKTYTRNVASSVKISSEGAVSFGGVGRHHNNRPNYVFQATAPYGPVVPLTNIPTNIMLGFGSDVEQLIDTTDVFFPAYKQRLGFGMDPGINDVPEEIKLDGNIYAPFSVYSSSVETGYNSKVVTQYKSGTMVTNLHNDFVQNHDVPMQGPFAEKFVGGRNYRHTEVNDGTDTRESRAEGFRLELGSLALPVTGTLGVVPPNYPFSDSPPGSAPHGYLPDLPTAQRFRDETAKRPVNIRNILMTTASIGTRLSGTIAHNQIGNYQKNYQVISTGGRSINDPFFQDQSFNFALNPETLATRGKFPLDPTSTENVGGDINYELPNRTGANSNQTVIVNRFSSPGEYSTLSRGYMDPAHEELSVNNASPYRNRRIIDYGISGSASLDPSIQNTIRVVDQISKNRGLNQLATLHAGQFGYDSAYGSLATIDQFPSWHKTNKNRVRNIVSSSAGYATGSIYDNLFVQHTIPRSEQQYSWITASLAAGQSILGLDAPSCFSASTLSSLAATAPVGSVSLNGDRVWGQDIRTGVYATHANYSASVINLDYVGLNTIIAEPVSASSHTLGYPEQHAILQFWPGPSRYLYQSTYINQDIQNGYQNIAGVFGPQDRADLIGDWGEGAVSINGVLNSILLNRNGPYGWPTWKQIRAGESPVARKLRETNQIGTTIAPSKIPNIIGGKQIGYLQPTRPNTFVDYFEAPVSKNSSPIYFYFEDNTDESNVANNLVLTVPYRNELDYFSNNGLNNRLGLQIDLDKRRAYNTVVDYTLSSDMSVVVNYSERLYPSALNAYKPIVRGRTEFTITNIWDDLRTNRSLTYGGQVGSMGQTVASASTWPMDGHISFTTTSSVNATDGAGELMNSYSRFSGSDSGITAAPTYAMRIPVGTTASLPVLVGDTEWLAPSQAGKNPYENYTTYAEKIRLIGKDYSIIPEFRISELMDTYINTYQGNFLADIDNIFELTGAAINNSSESGFYKTYTNADFLRYFSDIDDDLNEQRSGDLKIIRDKVALKCDALIKFLPYKGFYPAERTLELASLFSASYLAGADDLNPNAILLSDQAHRALIEPLFAPGILYNTVKSGLGVSNFVLLNTGSYSVIALAPSPKTSLSVATSTLPEGTIRFEAGGILNIGSSSANDTFAGFSTAKVPFEALYKPKAFFTNENLINLSGRNSSTRTYTGTRATWGYIIDTGISGTTSFLDNPLASVTNVPYVAGNLRASTPLYNLAIDNFLCEVTNIFVEDLTSFTSAREEDFAPVTKGTVYTMRLDLSRPSKAKSSTLREADTGSFDMYSRITGFGTPLNGRDHLAANVPSFSHVTPPYYAGAATVTLAFTASFSGIPTLDQVLSGTNLYYDRDEYNENEYATASAATYDPRMMINDCYNLLESLAEVPPNTNTQKKRWLIQSKFETPILNFASVNYAVPPTSSVITGDSADRIINKGMWMQHGSIPTGSSAGVFTSLTTEGANSLLDIVKFTPDTKRVGAVKSAFKLEEAIIAIPYREAKNRRNFIQIQDENKASSTYLKMVTAMDKYVFPPKFDFTRFDTVDPILMYIFEFSADLTQQDIADIWQNLPPDLSERFETKETVVEEKELIDLILNKDTDTKWMVFKVKKRAKKDFEKVRRSLISDADISAFPDAITSLNSYNWPYDYFSLVELAKIDEQVQYVSTDLKQNTRLSENEAMDVQRTTNASTNGGLPPGTGLDPVAKAASRVPTAIPDSIRRAAAAQPSKSAVRKTTTAATTGPRRGNRKGSK